DEPPRGREVRRRIGGSARVVAVPLDVAVTVHQTHRTAGVLDDSPIQVEAAAAVVDRTACLTLCRPGVVALGAEDVQRQQHGMNVFLSGLVISAVWVHPTDLLGSV